MTRERAILILKWFLHKQLDMERMEHFTEFGYDDVWEAVHLALETLESTTTAAGGET